MGVAAAAAVAVVKVVVVVVKAAAGVVVVVVVVFVVVVVAQAGTRCRRSRFEFLCVEHTTLWRTATEAGFYADDCNPIAG